MSRKFTKPLDQVLPDRLAGFDKRITDLELRQSQVPTITTETRFGGGEESVSTSATSVVVTLPQALTTDYTPHGIASWNSGAMYVTNKTSSQFTLNWPTAAGSGSPVVYWSFTRW